MGEFNLSLEARGRERGLLIKTTHDVSADEYVTFPVVCNFDPQDLRTEIFIKYAQKFPT